jgi:cysteine-rich repeat protein
LSWDDDSTTIFRKPERPLADGTGMRRRLSYLLARSAMLFLAGCTGAVDAPVESAGTQSPEAGVDAAPDWGAPIIVGGGFALPHVDARADISPPLPQAARFDAAPTPESGKLEASFAENDSWMPDGHAIDALGDSPVWKGRDSCDGPPDGPIDGPAADADAEAGSDGEADANADADADAVACGDGVVEPGEACDDGNANDFDACSNRCQPAAGHLIITEIVTRPGGAEMIEIYNPTAAPVDLSDYGLSDSHQYFAVAAGSFPTASGSDFAAFFPPGSQIPPGAYRTVAIANASGGTVSFETTYGKKPDFELRPKANGADGDPDVPDMQPAPGTSSIGALASLTDAGEPVVLFRYRSGSLVYDVDYVFYGSPSSANPAVDKTGVVVDGGAYQNECAGSVQKPAPAPGDGGALHRCAYGEGDETKTGGNAIVCHDETSEAFSSTFTRSSNQRTPGGPPPPGLCP